MDKINFENEFYSNLSSFIDLLRIPSIYDDKTVTDNSPYGKEVKNALNYMKNLCVAEGFKIKEYDNQVISASYGNGERIDIASHLDVVSVSDGWLKGPFSGFFDDSYIYGRGSQDMKSGAWLVFLALKLIKNQGIKLNKEIRLVYGSDEERTMNDMKYYISVEGKPHFAFSPDGRFPMAIGEKGALMWKMATNYDGIVVSLECGVQPNVVSPIAIARVKFLNKELVENYLSKNNINGEVDFIDGLMSIKIIGKSSHASRPQDSTDATVILLKLISELFFDSLITQLYKFFCDYYGNNGDIAYDIEPMGKLTVILGILKLSEGKMEALIDCRYPYGVTSDKLTSILKNYFSNWYIEKLYDDAPTLMSEDDDNIKIC